MDIQSLKNFLIVAREENVTRAAKELNLTQPTLSRQIHQLEKELGVPLFLRDKKRLKLTPQGNEFGHRAQELVNLALRAYEDVRKPTADISGEIIIGCNDAGDIDGLASLIASFRKRFPLINFTLLSGHNIEIRSQLDNCVVDIGLLAEPANTDGLACMQMPKKKRWGILVKEKSDYGSLSSVRSTQLVGHPLITIRDEAMDDELTSWAGKNAARMVPAAHYNLLSNAAALVDHEIGVAVCAEPDQRIEGLCFIPFAPALRCASVIAWRAQRELPPQSQKFVDFILEPTR